MNATRMELECDSWIAARHAEPRTTMRYDRGPHESGLAPDQLARDDSRPMSGETVCVTARSAGRLGRAPSAYPRIDD